MPALGFGVWQIPDPEAEKATREALASGYRSIDTAQIYANEEGVGRAIASSGVARPAAAAGAREREREPGARRDPSRFR